jgi:hypothetical protein
MARQLQTGKTAHGDRLWLAALIDAMDEASRPEPHGLACSETTLSAFRAQLGRPAALASTHLSSAYSFRNQDHSPANCSRGRVRRSIPRSRASSRQT